MSRGSFFQPLTTTGLPADGVGAELGGAAVGVEETGGGRLVRLEAVAGPAHGARGRRGAVAIRAARRSAGSVDAIHAGGALFLRSTGGHAPRVRAAKAAVTLIVGVGAIRWRAARGVARVVQTDATSST